MSKKKKIIFAVITVLIMIIISFIVPVKRELEGYKYGNGDFDITDHETFNYTIYTYKNKYTRARKAQLGHPSAVRIQRGTV